MADEKKIKNEELTDEQANEAAGGIGSVPRYNCQGGCGRTYEGLAKFYVNYQPYCPSCYNKYQQTHNDLGGRPDHHERP